MAGQLLVDATAGDRTVLFRGNVTGLKPSGGDEVLDANAALTFRPDVLDLEGRIQVVRVGRQHLLDALDLLDPYHEDVNINRTRLALAVGYPERVRVRFERGFLSASLDLGGVAGLVEIEEIRGVPIGPVLQKYLGPLIKTGEDK